MHVALLLTMFGIGLTQGAEQTNAAPQSKGARPPATKSSDNNLNQKVQRLVRQLDAPEIGARDQAYAELLKLGPDVFLHLPKPADNVPAAVRDAVRRLRDEFDRQAADQAMQASRVTIQGQGISLKDAASQIAKQSGNKVLLNDELAAGKTVNLELQKASFWNAVDALADQAELAVYNFAQDAVELRPAPPDQRPRTEGAFYTGPLRFQATRLQLQRDPRLRGEGSLSVGVEISWEPRLRPIMLRQKLDALNARDETRGEIAVEGEGELPVLVHQGASAVELELPFKAPARSVKSIASLTGKVEVLVPGKMETFDFGGLDNAKQTDQQRHNATVTLEGVRKANEIWEVRMRVKYEQAFNALDSHLVAWILNNEAYLLDSKGEKVENAGFETTHRSEDAIGVAYLFEAPQGLAGYKFVYHTPSTIYRLPVSYELKDLTLP